MGGCGEGCEKYLGTTEISTRTPVKREISVPAARKLSCICLLGEIVSYKSYPRTKSLSSPKKEGEFRCHMKNRHCYPRLGVWNKLSKMSGLYFIMSGQKPPCSLKQYCLRSLGERWSQPVPHWGPVQTRGYFHQLSGAGRYLCRTRQEIRLLNYSLSPRGPISLHPLPTDVLSKQVTVTIYLAKLKIPSPELIFPSVLEVFVLSVLLP